VSISNSDNNNKNSIPTLNLSQSTSEDIDFLQEKMMLLHHFETQDGDNNLQVNLDFADKIRSWLALEVENPASLLFNIYANQQRIGFAFLKILDNQNDFTIYQSYGLLQSIWIDEAYQNKSYGRQTVEFIETIFKEQKIPYYEVNYAASNLVAEKFWQSCGMVASAVTARKFLT